MTPAPDRPDLEAIRKLAEAVPEADSGPWRVEQDGAEEPWVFPHGAFAGDEATTNYIAACSPLVLLALLDELDRLESRLSAVEGENEQLAEALERIAADPITCDCVNFARRALAARKARLGS